MNAQDGHYYSVVKSNRMDRMIVTIESQAKPCPGVKRAVSMAEDLLRRNDILYSAGQLIHNRREIERLHGMGLQEIGPGALEELLKRKQFNGEFFLIRTHGETEEILKNVQKSSIQVVDATCPIVRHSQDLIDQHIKEGWGIIIAGDKKHAEVMGLMARTKSCGVVVSSIEETSTMEFEDRSLLLAQTTIDPEFFSDIRRALLNRLPGLKIVDTTCRFIRKRQVEVRNFSAEQDVFLLVGGHNSANCRLLYNTALNVNKQSYRIEGPKEIDKKWLKNCNRLGISGGASTPRWQLEEVMNYINNYQVEKNPKGLENRKGGTFLWWMRKNHKMKKRRI